MIDFARFKNLTYDDFRRLASDPTLSLHEKIGYPDSYREGYGEAIFADIRRKLLNLEKLGVTVVDIGAGCAEPPRLLIEHSRALEQRLIMIDAPEMLRLLPDADHLTKLSGMFPSETMPFVQEYAGKVDVVLIYGVVQTLFSTGSIHHFLDVALSLLAPGGQLLVGDLPNISKRKRFFASENGVAYHKTFMQTDQAPEVQFNTLETDQIDDGVILGLLMRARMMGFDAYWLQMSPDLPMANRREDLLFVRP